MTKSDSRYNFLNRIRTFQREDTAHYRNSVRCRPSQNIIQPLHHIESKFVNFRICSVNVEIIRRSCRDVGMLGSRAADILYEQTMWYQN